ncbi:MAG TPA: hypothetical protein VK395_10565 [Gemmataceae bacterium]|nr:hypothetical protein [Gemmataceae bacterium]
MIHFVILFGLGVTGSFAVELLKIVYSYERGRPLPARYSQKGFWIARTFLAMIGGILVLIYGVQNEYLAFQIGAGTQGIIESIVNKSPENPLPPNPAPANVPAPNP